MRSLIVVNHHAADRLERLLASPHGCDEVIVVDHSESQAEAVRLKSMPIDRLIVAVNRGYAAGLNRGAGCAAGDRLFLANPDIRFLPGCSERLAAILDDPSVGAAAPRFHWAAEEGWLLPQATPVTPAREILGAISPRAASRLYLREQVRGWRSPRPVDMQALSGALIAVRRDAWDAAGGFDPGYFLFFEENDFCLRLRKRRFRLVAAPGPGVVHDVGISLRREERSGHHERSLARYRKKHYPRWLRSVRMGSRADNAAAVGIDTRIEARDGDVWLLSTDPGMIPSASRVAEAGETPETLSPSVPEPGTWWTAVWRNNRPVPSGMIRVE